MTQRLSHPEFDAISWDRWEPVDHATLCFVIRNGQVLLIEKKRGLGAGKINAPGGRFEPGETAEQCAVRETEEELLVTPTGLREQGVLRFQFKDGYALQCHVFSATGCEGTATETEEAVPRWTDLALIPYEQMWADDELWLPAFLGGKAVDGEFLFDGEAMLGYRLELSG